MFVCAGSFSFDFRSLVSTALAAHLLPQWHACGQSSRCLCLPTAVSQGITTALSLSPTLGCGSEIRKPGLHVPPFILASDAQTGHLPPPACSLASFWAVLDSPPLAYQLRACSFIQNYTCSLMPSIFLASRGQTKHCLAAGGKETTTDSETSWDSLTGSSSLAPQYCCIQHEWHRGERPGLEMMSCLLLDYLLLAVAGGDTLDRSAVSPNVLRKERGSWTDLPISSLDEI